MANDNHFHEQDLSYYYYSFLQQKHVCREMELTCCGDRLMRDAKCSLSGADKYFCCLNLRSNS